MEIHIRPLTTPADCRAAEEVQMSVWGREDPREIVPDHMLIAAQHHGAILLGAWTPQQALIGIVFSIIGRSSAGQIEQYSHLGAVLPTYQSQGVGEQLKWAQREHTLAQGIERVSWTYDPLESRNAYLNIHKLGAVCRAYTRDYYGPMRDPLNIGTPTDRFTVAWLLNSAHVTERRNAPAAPPTLAGLRAAGATLLNAPSADTLPRPAATLIAPQGTRVLIAVPSSYQQIKIADHDLAQTWRLHTRALFEDTFAAGYTVTDLIPEPPLSYYLLEQVEGRGTQDEG